MKPTETLTLAEAITQARQEYANLSSGKNDKEKTWFLNHDATHIIFGTKPFDLKGEMMNDIWTLFGSTVTLKEYMVFNKFVPPKVALKSYGSKFKILVGILKLLPTCILVFKKTRKMQQKWQWHIDENILEQKVGDLRKAFNIEVID